MNEHEDLIAEAHEHLDKAADAAPVSARQAILTGKVEDQRMSLVARLVHALEKVTAERDGLSSLREQMSLRLRYVEGKREQAEAERDGLAAVAEQVRREIRAFPDYGARYVVESILNDAPSVAFDRVKAEALREAADAFEGGTINVEIFGDSAETRYWQGVNESRGSLVASLRDRADRIEKGESNE